ncbi:MAG: hypothetical protein NHB32_21260 [Fischerella sp. CENA71]|nr:hypothetical protein [Fischerella sp. CENA71]
MSLSNIFWLDPRIDERSHVVGTRGHRHFIIWKCLTVTDNAYAKRSYNTTIAWHWNLPTNGRQTFLYIPNRKAIALN